LAKLDNLRQASAEDIFNAMGESSGKDWAIEKTAELNQLLWKTYLIRSFVICFIGLVIWLKPDSQDMATWFARSGSLLVVLAVASEIWLSRIQREVFQENSHGLYCQIYVEKRFAAKARFSYWLDWSIGIIGTIIWGYGDLIWQMLFNAN
jgi:hypothetical protein